MRSQAIGRTTSRGSSSAIRIAATRSPEAANPAWVLRGMKLDVVKNLIKDYERNENV